MQAFGNRHKLMTVQDAYEVMDEDAPKTSPPYCALDAAGANSDALDLAASAFSIPSAT